MATKVTQINKLSIRLLERFHGGLMVFPTIGTFCIRKELVSQREQCRYCLGTPI